MQAVANSPLFAVVPIFTNLGAAVLPMVLAAIGSVVAIAFRPKELLRLCRENPATVLKSIAVFAVLVVGAFLSYHFFTSAGSQRAAQPHFDWAKFRRSAGF